MAVVVGAHGELAMQQMMQQMSDPQMAMTPAVKSMIASLLGATKLLADIGRLRGRLGAALWPLFAIALGVYMFGYRV